MYTAPNAHIRDSKRFFWARSQLTLTFTVPKHIHLSALCTFWPDIGVNTTTVTFFWRFQLTNYQRIIIATIHLRGTFIIYILPDFKTGNLICQARKTLWKTSPSLSTTKKKRAKLTMRSDLEMTRSIFRPMMTTAGRSTFPGKRHLTVRLAVVSGTSNGHRQEIIMCWYLLDSCFCYDYAVYYSKLC